MAVCDICDQVMPGVHPSEMLQPGSSLPIGWQSATHAEVTRNEKIVKRALIVHLKKFGISSDKITIKMMEDWVEEKERIYGQTAWLLCPKCSGLLDRATHTSDSRPDSSENTLKPTKTYEGSMTYEKQRALWLPEAVLTVFSHGAAAAELADGVISVSPEVAQWAIPYARSISSARTLFQQGNFKEALEEYQRILDELPDAAMLLNDSGVCCAKMGNNEMAFQLIQKALSFAPLEKKEEIFANLLKLGEDESLIPSKSTDKQKWWKLWRSSPSAPNQSIKMRFGKTVRRSGVYKCGNCMLGGVYDQQIRRLHDEGKSVGIEVPANFDWSNPQAIRSLREAILKSMPLPDKIRKLIEGPEIMRFFNAGDLFPECPNCGIDSSWTLLLFIEHVQCK